MRPETLLALLPHVVGLATALDFSSASDLDTTSWTPRNVAASVEGRVSGDSRYDARSRKAVSGGWNPPSNLAKPLKEVWDHCKKTYNSGDLFGFKNYGWDQLMAGKGKINYCVRWDSKSTVTQAKRDQIATVINEQIQKWYSWVYGYDNFPYKNITVKVVGWAVRDRSLLQGSTSGITVYTDKDSQGVPQCAESCGRYFHLDGDYSRCAAGKDNHYDHSLWLTDGYSGGTGGDWGQRIGSEYFLGALTSADIHILLHEMGHTYGLDDFYDWTPTGVTSFIMNSGSAMKITDFDGWMLRNWWYELSRNRGWQKSQ